MMERLRQAIDKFDEFFQSGDTLTFEGELAAAARLVLEGERVDWCEQHKEHRRFGFPTCWEWGVLGGFGPPCRMVERLLTEVPKEEVK